MEWIVEEIWYNDMINLESADLWSDWAMAGTM